MISEYFGWRTVYFIAAACMATVSALLYFIMEGRSATDSSGETQSYTRLILSIFPIIRTYPEILISGAIQGLGFGTFLAGWMGIG